MDTGDLSKVLKDTHMELTGNQRSYLIKKSHTLRPVVIIGKKGVTDALIHALDQALASHELVKVKFLGLKEERHAIAPGLAGSTGSVLVAVLGNKGIFFRSHSDPEKRKIHLPEPH